ncbi:MAG: aldehyde dehydrogenase family protein, partial [Gemmatimonadota bacterium]|nr:aldehyde dehydrogenase family protein [Gemmatimonadota bacterium]
MSGSTIERAALADLVRDLTATSGDTARVIAPFTGELLHELPLSSVQDVADATAAARVAQAAWWSADEAHRRSVLLRAHDLLLERREELLDAVQTETGKTRGQAFEEVFNAANSTRYNALSARRVLRGGRRRGGIPFVFSPRVHYTPKGVVAVVTPWNYPLSLAVMDIAPALAAGNGVIQKADNQGAISILAARRAFIDAGLPAALWAVVTGDGATIGNAVVDAGDYVVFTGSTATGRRVAERAAGRLVGSSMELGGKNAAIVLDDIDPVKTAAAVANFSFTASGQLCVSAERIYVLKGVADTFIPALAARVQSLRIGPAFDYSTDFGSLATAQQLENVMAHIDDAKKKGVTVLAGGNARPDIGPYFVEPTVLTDVTPDMKCATAETFGPVVS